MEGFWKEHGPYLVRNGAPGVARNPLSLTKLAHVLYLEHPVRRAGAEGAQGPDKTKALYTP